MCLPLVLPTGFHHQIPGWSLCRSLRAKDSAWFSTFKAGLCGSKSSATVLAIGFAISLSSHSLWRKILREHFQKKNDFEWFWGTKHKIGRSCAVNFCEMLMFIWCFFHDAEVADFEQPPDCVNERSGHGSTRHDLMLEIFPAHSCGCPGFAWANWKNPLVIQHS